MADTTPEDPPVTWRDGIHLSHTPIWCDALRARDICFLSNAHALARSRHGQLIATAATLELYGESATGAHLAVPYGRPFTLGTVRLELIRSGHGLGGASLLAEVAGYRVLYSNSISLRGGGLGGQAEVRACDALVVGAHYGDARFRFPAVEEVLAQVLAWTRETMARGGAAVLLMSSPSKALDVLMRLADAFAVAAPGVMGPSFFAHRAFCDAAQAVRASHPNLPRLRRATGRALAGRILFWPMGKRENLPEPLPEHSRVALLSGAALDPDVVAAVNPDVAYPWSDRADYQELVQYIDACAAERVFLTHRFADPLAAALERPGRAFQALGPPRQIELF
jgi:Cft2 family RNA processing exonuclease